MSASDSFHSCGSRLDGGTSNDIQGLTKPNIEINFTSERSEYNFELLCLLGKGSFAKVYEVKKKNGKDIDQIYAMKVLDKEKVAKKRRTFINTERNILVRMDHQFIAKLYYTLQNSTHLFFILEYLPGGELLAVLNNQKVLSEDAASFYTKELVLALEHLHLHGIVYRDLKPANILLGAQGHIKIIDFGLSKENMDRGQFTYTICGSRTYCAPEVASRQGHGTPADWWSLGVLFYLMVVGKKPFDVTKTSFTKFDYSKYFMPENLTSEAQSLIKGLLEIHQIERLGSSGPNRIKKHPFFKGTDWDAVLLKKEIPPFLPPVRNKSDFSQIDSNWANLETSTSDYDNSIFKDFDYVCPSLLQEDTTDSVTNKINFNLLNN